MKNKFKPEIIAFLCNWCSYEAADAAGRSGEVYPSDIKVIRVMCTGRIDPQLILKAFEKGADGVMILGCHPGDCHYKNGNMRAFKMYTILKDVIKDLGVDERRFVLKWVSAKESARLAEIMRKTADSIKELGPLNIAEKQ
ncbi:MAG: hydrogenase iron-sulfur subunit [Candidatus Omnitrophota bacterium]